MLVLNQSIFKLVMSSFNSPPLVQTPVVLAKDVAELGEGRLWGDVAARDHLVDCPTCICSIVFMFVFVLYLYVSVMSLPGIT